MAEQQATLDNNDKPKALLSEGNTTNTKTGQPQQQQGEEEGTAGSTNINHNNMSAADGDVVSSSKPAPAPPAAVGAVITNTTTANTAANNNSNNKNSNVVAVEFELEPIQDKLICNMCNGFFRDPYTTMTCLHTFCKSCLYFVIGQGHYNCPTCDTYLGQDVHKIALPDRVLQNIIDKVLFPSLAEQDTACEIAFYQKCGIKRKPEYAIAGTTAVVEDTTPAGAAKKRHYKQQRGRPSSSSSLAKRNKKNKASMVMVQLEPVKEKKQQGKDDKQPAIPSLKFPTIQTNGSIRIGQLKKYLALKLQPTTPSSSSATNIVEQDPDPSSSSSITTELLEIMLDDVPLGNELSVNFIIRTVWMGDPSNEPLPLHYRLLSNR